MHQTTLFFLPPIGAICSDHKTNCMKILDKEMNKNPSDVHGYTALHVAAEYGRTEIFKYIMDMLDIKVCIMT